MTLKELKKLARLRGTLKMRWYQRKNGMARVVLIGKHPTKDFVAISSGTGDDIRYVSLLWFITNFVEIK